MYEDGMTIAAVLADTLRAKDLTQTAAAELLGVRQPVVSRWIRGENTPADEHVAALVKLTGLTRNQVLSAIHAQRLDRATIPARMAALEEEVAALRAEIASLVQQLERVFPPGS